MRVLVAIFLLVIINLASDLQCQSVIPEVYSGGSFNPDDICSGYALFEAKDGCLAGKSSECRKYKRIQKKMEKKCEGSTNGNSKTSEKPTEEEQSIAEEKPIQEKNPIQLVIEKPDNVVKQLEKEKPTEFVIKEKPNGGNVKKPKIEEKPSAGKNPKEVNTTTQEEDTIEEWNEKQKQIVTKKEDEHQLNAEEKLINEEDAELINESTAPGIEILPTVEESILHAPRSFAFDSHKCFARIIDAEINIHSASFFTKNRISEEPCSFDEDAKTLLANVNFPTEIGKYKLNVLPVLIDTKENIEFHNSLIPFNLTNRYEQWKNKSIELGNLNEPFGGCESGNHHGRDPECTYYKTWLKKTGSQYQFRFLLPTNDGVYLISPGDAKVKRKIVGLDQELFRNANKLSKKDKLKRHNLLSSIAIVAANSQKFKVIKEPTNKNQKILLSGIAINGEYFLIGLDGNEFYHPIKAQNIKQSRLFMSKVYKSGLESIPILNKIINDWYDKVGSKSIIAYLPERMMTSSNIAGNPLGLLAKVQTKRESKIVFLEDSDFANLRCIVYDGNSYSIISKSLNSKILDILNNNRWLAEKPLVTWMLLADWELVILRINQHQKSIAVCTSEPDDGFVVCINEKAEKSFTSDFSSAKHGFLNFVMENKNNVQLIEKQFDRLLNLNVKKISCE